MASRKSRSSVRSVPKVDSTARFRAAIDALIAGDPNGLPDVMEKAIRTDGTRRCANAYRVAAEESSRRSSGGDRPDRINPPFLALSPLP